MRQGGPKHSIGRLSAGVAAAPDADAERKSLQQQASVAPQRGAAQDEERWEGIIAASEAEAVRHAAVAVRSAAQKQGYVKPKLQPLLSNAELEALPAAQRPEPGRAYFAKPFAWRYQVSIARASLGDCKGVPESALLPPHYRGYSPRGSLRAVLTQGLQYRLLANMCTGRREPIGWQVLALEDIPAGDFIIEYTGEYITNDEARLREKPTNKQGSRCFLYDLEFHKVRKEKNARTVREELSPFCVIDATHMGNMSKLFNHCCSPNVKAVEVRQRHGYSRLVMFALRDIKRGEHLDLDYIPEFSEASRELDGLMECLCGADNCRGVTL